MGYYINSIENEHLGPKGKAESLIKLAGATKLNGSPKKIPLNEGIICVVDNGPFEAAAFVYSDAELKSFEDPTDYRRKIWLSMPLDKAKKFSGYN